MIGFPKNYPFVAVMKKTGNVERDPTHPKTLLQPNRLVGTVEKQQIYRYPLVNIQKNYGKSAHF